MIHYDITYYDNLLRAYSATARQISDIRWEFISSLRPKTVLDYGCGVGWFRAFKPDGVEVDTFDIGPFTQTGIRREAYDVVCFYDVLEHIPDWDTIRPVIEKATYVAGTVPILVNGQVLSSWKHYKPGEHFYYWSEEGFEEAMNEVGLEKIEHGWPECPPRKDILSFKYRRK